MKDSSLRKVLIIGSGPIVIGQAAEFDYAGTQACKAVREEGITTVLVNSNPATIMTDEDVADVVYIEPLTVEIVERIIRRERPDGLLATLGGQTGLNLAREVQEAGILERYGVRLLGTPISAIRQAEDRDLFRRLMLRINEPIPGSDIAHTVAEGRSIADRLGFPLIIRPAYTLGGTGGGIAEDPNRLDELVKQGVEASPIGQVLVEEYLSGWKEIEYEVMRDAAGTCVTICNMENFDPMGVHTGDSIVFAPSQTLSDKEYQLLRSASLKIIDALDIAGGCNVQLALDPNSFQYRVIEVNPRVSRSSALASKATGYPIARIAAKIAIGFRLDELANPITGETAAAFEPALDYVVAKIPRWPFDKFPTADRSLGTQMKATGEVMSIERTIEGAVSKALRSLEISGRSMLWEDPGWSDRQVLDRAISHPNDQRLWAILAALRRGRSVEEIFELSAIDRFFIAKLANLIAMELRLLEEPLDAALLWDAKRLGVPDSVIAQLADYLPDRVRELRKRLGIVPVYKLVDTCAAEFAAVTPYFYSTYEAENEAGRQPGQAAVVVGSGPIRIGQGIEFDYCSVHSAWALQESGWRAVMINSNPETVSTDFDTSDRLYFEALDVECVADIIDNESGGGDPRVVVQFGGQTAINLAEPLYNMGVSLSGSDAASIDASEDREKLDGLLEELGIPRPPGATVRRIEDALSVARRIGYPVLIRPSYVLGGRAMEIASDPAGLSRYVATVTQPSPEHPVLIDKYLQGLEVEVDAVCDGHGVLIPGIMEHIERAGVHSGDSFAVYPTQHVASHLKEVLVDYTDRIARAVRAVGLLNIQYVIWENQVYVIEVNPRASRTVPFLSKVTGIPMVGLATKAMLGQTLPEQGWDYGHAPEGPLVAVKAPVFSHAKLTGVDSFLGPEMKSTGEAMGVDFGFAPALRKAMLAAGLGIPDRGTVIMSVADRDKPEALPIARSLNARGYHIKATRGTARFLAEAGIPAETINRLDEASPGQLSLLDHVRDPTTVLVVNTLTWDRPTLEDGFRMRRSANERMLPCLTSLDTAAALVQALESADEEFVLPIDYYRHDRRQ